LLQPFCEGTLIGKLHITGSPQ